MSAFCPRENPDASFPWKSCIHNHGTTWFSFSSNFSFKCSLNQWCRTRSWFQKVHSEDDFSCRTNKLCFLFKPLFLLTKLKSRHAERTQFEGYSVAKGRVSLLKASGYPVFKMHLLKVAKVNILCLSCTQNLLQSRQPKCTQLCLCSGAVVLKK